MRLSRIPTEATAPEVRPLLEEGVKQILCSPASWAVKVNLLEEPPRCETTRCMSLKTSSTDM